MSRNVSIVLIASALATLIVASPSFGQTMVVEKKFVNCSALNQVYPGGVAKNAKVTNKGGETKYSPAVKPAVYKKNLSKDRDKDGIACEK